MAPGILAGPLVECVPNFSEGRDARVIAALARAAAAVPGILILDLQTDPDHNRSVLTFAGPPEAVRKPPSKPRAPPPA